MLYSKIQKMVICLGILLFYIASAKEQISSPLPVPEQEVLDTGVDKCSKSCLNKLYENGKFFSFVALYHPTKDKALLEKYQDITAIIGVSPLAPIFDSKETLHVALMLPQKNIGRYSASSADAILAYLIARGDNFSFKVFDSRDEEVNNIVGTYNKIKSEEYDFVIGIITPKGLGNLLQNTDITIPLFVPTINEKRVENLALNHNIFFGGIDYEKQVDMILNLAKQKQSAIISLNDDGIVGKMIGMLLQSRSNTTILQESIDTAKSTDFTPIISKIRSSIKNSMVVLNTSVLKSGLIIPQMGNAKVMPIAFLSTQINYNPSLLSLMPKEDSKKLFVVNAISPIHTRLLLFNELLSADFQYDWVNYATALLVDIFMAQQNKMNVRFFTENLQGNQILYNDRFYGVKDSHFIPVRLK